MAWAITGKKNSIQPKNNNNNSKATDMCEMKRRHRKKRIIKIRWRREERLENEEEGVSDWEKESDIEWGKLPFIGAL